MLIIAAFVGIPIAVLVVIILFVQWAGPWMPVLLIAAAAIGIGYAVYRLQTSGVMVRRRYEREVLELIARAETQQKQLPREIDQSELTAALARRDVRTDIVPLASILAPANAIYADEFWGTPPTDAERAD